MKEKLMQAYAWFQKNSTVVKIVFITFVMAFVIFEIINIATGIDYPSLKEKFNFSKPGTNIYYVYRGLNCCHSNAFV